METDESDAAAAIVARRLTVIFTVAVVERYEPSAALVAVTTQVSATVPAVTVVPDKLHVPEVIA